jgi:SPP1 family predicted phage head-tail adaptor
MPLIGAMRERITLQKKVATPDGQGGHTVAYAVRAVVAAAFEALTGREAIAAQQVTATFDRAIVIRYRADVSVTDRVVWGGVTLQILTAVDPDDDNRFLRLTCTEVQV